jgi:hypothetical protein
MPAKLKYDAVTKRKFGSNEAVSTSEVDINSFGDHTILTANTSLEIISGDAQDNATGTGARSVTIEGLDAAGNEISDTVVPTGLSAKAITTQFAYPLRAYVTDVGSNEANVGLLTIRVASAGATQITIPAGEGQSQLCAIQVPAGKQAILQAIDYSIAQASGSAVVCKIRLKKRPAPGKSWRTFTSLYGTGHDEIEFFGDEYVFPAGTDIKATAIKQSGTGNAEVELAIHYIEQSA